jgi:ubiquitin carboxyl-terminal hydrolase 4/11/15
LKHCLDYFRQTEKLEKDNAWYCNICKNHVEATKKIDLYTVPPVLIFCLQRFKSHNIYFKEKLEDKILFPISNLDMTPFVLSEELKNEHSLMYDLYAVSNHYGSLAFGHYTAYCKNYLTGVWYDYNDSSVSTLDNINEVVSGAAYVLYYIRKDFFPDKEINFEAIKIKLDDLLAGSPVDATSPM